MIVDGSEDWYMSAEKYVGPAMNSVEINLAKSNQCLPTHCKTSIVSDYFPETDTSPKLKSERGNTISGYGWDTQVVN